MDIKYSIIVPIYGVEKYLCTCIESLIKQPFNNLEIILVDDGSKDACPRICDDYRNRDNRIVVIHKENGGLVSARQAGAEIAQGDYIMCVDGDDWVSDDYIEVIDTIINTSNPDVVCFGANKVNESGVCIGVASKTICGFFDKNSIRDDIYPCLIEDAFGHYYSPSIWSKAYKKELYVPCQLALSRTIKIGEDHACTKPILSKANSIAVTDNRIYNYRVNDSSMTKERKPFNFDVPELIGRHFEKNIDLSENDFQEQIYRCVTHLLFNTCVSAFYEKASYKSIKKKIKKTLSQDYYCAALNNCKYDFRYVKGQAALFALKHRCYLLMKIYSMKLRKGKL